jgi:hypothetical protein
MVHGRSRAFHTPQVYDGMESTITSVMNRARPVCTILSLATCLTFFVLSFPLLRYSVSEQLSEASYNSADAQEDAGRMAGFAVIGGAFISGVIGAAVGLVLLAVAHWRGEQAHGMSSVSLLLNGLAVMAGLKLLWPLLRF